MYCCHHPSSILIAPFDASSPLECGGFATGGLALGGGQSSSHPLGLLHTGLPFAEPLSRVAEQFEIYLQIVVCSIVLNTPLGA